MKVNCTESGQRGAYSDSYYGFEITLEEGENPTIEEILTACQNGRRLPQEEWRKRQNEAESFNERASVYFRGWYILNKTDKGYIYKGCNPYRLINVDQTIKPFTNCDGCCDYCSATTCEDRKTEHIPTYTTTQEDINRARESYQSLSNEDVKELLSAEYAKGRYDAIMEANFQKKLQEE